LAGLVDFAKTEPRDYYRIHVGTHAIVSLLGPIVGYHQQRATYATAEFADLFGKGFQFGVYLDLETMNVAIQTLFIQTPERDAVLKVIGNVRDELVQTSGDDGVTQTVTAKAGVAIVQELKVPNPVTLQPYRTFREVGQPASPFVLRMRRGQGPVGPTAALFESDGGAWRLEAIANIHNWLKDKLPTIPIIA
jgi:hypothetical protein